MILRGRFKKVSSEKFPQAQPLTKVIMNTPLCSSKKTREGLQQPPTWLAEGLGSLAGAILLIDYGITNLPLLHFVCILFIHLCLVYVPYNETWSSTKQTNKTNLNL